MTNERSRSDEQLAMITPNERDALMDFVVRLRGQFGHALRRVVLFGSKARGEGDDESDLDLLVIVRIPTGRYRQYWHTIVDLAWETETRHGVVISLVVKDEREYAHMLDHRLLLVRNIEQDGIELCRNRDGSGL